MITTQALTKVFRTAEVETTALSEVDLAIAEGEFVAVMGPSGCGKSTLLNILGLLDNPTSGSYSLLGQDVSGYPERKRSELRKRNIGFVFQNFNLIEELTINTGLLAVLSGNVDLDFSMRGFGGELEGSYAASKTDGWSVDVDARDIKLQYIPQVAAAVGLPVRGRLTGKVILAVPLNRWSNATGSGEVSCAGCAVGDGKAKLKVPGNPMLAMGIKMPRIRLGQLGGRVSVQKGVASLDNVSARSPDIELHLEGTVNLRQPLAFSSVNGYLRFKISPELKRRDPKFELLENGLTNAKRTDGFFGMRLSGTVKNCLL